MSNGDVGTSGMSSRHVDAAKVGRVVQGQQAQFLDEVADLVGDEPGRQ